LRVRWPAAGRAEFERYAAAVGWRVPPALAVLAFPDERVTRIAARLPSDSVVARVGTMGYAVVPDPAAPGRLAVIAHAMTGVRCALGPTVSVAAAATSARLARLALGLPDAGDGLLVADQRRVDLL